MLLLSRKHILHYFDLIRKRFFLLLLTKWRVECVGGWVARHGRTLAVVESCHKAEQAVLYGYRNSIELLTPLTPEGVGRGQGNDMKKRQGAEYRLPVFHYAPSWAAYSIRWTCPRAVRSARS